MMRYAMALSGGGARGAAHVGVLLALEEAGLPPGALAGTSAGAVVAGLYACGLGAERLRRLVEDIARGRICLVDPVSLKAAGWRGCCAGRPAAWPCGT